MNKLIAILLAAALLMGMGAWAMAEGSLDADEVVVEAGEGFDEVEPEGDDYADEEENLAAADDAGEAPAEPLNVLGTWYGAALGMQVQLDFAADNGYTMQIAGVSGTRKGVWTREEDQVILDAGKETELTLDVEDNALSMSISGVEVTLGRESVKGFTPPAEKDTARLKDYAGNWTCTMVGMLDMFVDPIAEGEGSPVDLSISGETIVISGGLDEEPITAAGVYAEGVLHMALGETSEDGEISVEQNGLSCTLRVLKDDMLRMEVATQSGTITYYLTKVQ